VRTRARLLGRDHRDLPPPVVILGMHRSGTTALTEMLSQAGLEVGRDIDVLHESAHFQQINIRLLGLAGARWTDVGPFLDRVGDAAFRRTCRSVAEDRLRKGFARRFLGWPMHRAAAGTAWGWKDPRTCITVAVWHEVFPEARFLHITRHPLDVAISLKTREERRRQRGKRPEPTSGELSHSLDLWETYVRSAATMRSAGSRYHEVRYEDLMADPGALLPGILRFCGLDDGPDTVAAAASLADGTRTRRFDEEPYRSMTAAVAGIPLARELGYA
jgi:hypothetical protein